MKNLQALMKRGIMMIQKLGKWQDAITMKLCDMDKQQGWEIIKK
jgi:hypothetical protein